MKWFGFTFLSTHLGAHLCARGYMRRNMEFECLLPLELTNCFPSFPQRRSVASLAEIEIIYESFRINSFMPEKSRTCRTLKDKLTGESCSKLDWVLASHRPCRASTESPRDPWGFLPLLWTGSPFKCVLRQGGSVLPICPIFSSGHFFRSAHLSTRLAGSHLN